VWYNSWIMEIGKISGTLNCDPEPLSLKILSLPAYWSSPHEACRGLRPSSPPSVSNPSGVFRVNWIAELGCSVCFAYGNDHKFLLCSQGSDTVSSVHNQ
jgi:hypothetical protein